MSKSSPGVRRVVSILNFFADHPGQAFTLTDLVRALKLSRATCHGLLTGLVEAGYLFRGNDKSYLLGPAIVAIGEVAKSHFSPLSAAQPEMRALADAYDVTCVAAFREHGDVLVRERAASVSHLGLTVPRGSRLPLVPSLAGPFFVHASRAAIAEWLDDLDPPASPERRAQLEASVAFAQRHGFIGAMKNPRVQQPLYAARWIENGGHGEGPLMPIIELDPMASYTLVFLTAPVLSGRETAFCLAMQGFVGDFTGAQVTEMGAQLRAACDRIARFMGTGARRG